MGARQVDALRILDFCSYVLWIEQWIAEASEAKQKADKAAEEAVYAA